MLKFTINGREVRPDQIADELTMAVKQTAFDQIAREFRERVEAIRHPETGEFPTVVVGGESVEAMALKVEGSPQLLALVKERLSLEDASKIEFASTEVHAPRAFLSFAWENKALAERIATDLRGAGIDTWFAGWELAAGDSMRQEIDKGLGQCTHFVVLLTPESIERPWVNQEMDAGLIRKIEEKTKFIALRSRVSAAQLPPLLRGMISPNLDDYESAIQQLVGDIHGVSRKPPLGAFPPASTMPSTGYSAAASAVAKVLVQGTTTATFGDPQRTIEELVGATGLTEDDVRDAIHELGGMIQYSYDRIFPKGELFATFDKYWMDWDPAVDALRIAADLVNDPDCPKNAPDIAARYEWQPRRLNPALAYLLNRGLIEDRIVLGSQPWLMHWVEKSNATRRFVKSRS